MTAKNTSDDVKDTSLSINALLTVNNALEGQYRGVLDRVRTNQRLERGSGPHSRVITLSIDYILNSNIVQIYLYVP